VLFAVGAKNGRKAWKYVSHRCNASSPAVAGHVVYETFMNAPPCNRKPSGKLTGELIAFTVGDGRVLWRKTIYPSESSPVVTQAPSSSATGAGASMRSSSGAASCAGTQAARAGEERRLDRR
jgi:outer membrane protein assembly factor BamB